MHTILGANGQIVNYHELELVLNHTSKIKLVSRHPQKVNNTDLLLQGEYKSSNIYL